jgi:hypothetical protein
MPSFGTRAFAAPLAALLALLPGAARAQSGAEVLGGFGLGGTYYCIVSRCDTGTTVTGAFGYAPRPAVLLEASGRWHACFDCGRFVIGEGSVQLRLPRGAVRPFVAAGGGMVSDPDLMGDRLSLLVAAGAHLRPESRWGVQLELRGRRVGRGDAMGVASVVLLRRWRRPS